MKSGTGQKMILNMITTSVMIQLGRVKGNKMVNMQLSNKKACGPWYPYDCRGTRTGLWQSQGAAVDARFGEKGSGCVPDLAITHS